MPTPGPNVIIGTDGADVIHGTAGNDVIFGMGGISRNPNAGSIRAVRVGTGFGGAVFASSAPGDPNHLYVSSRSWAFLFSASASRSSFPLAFGHAIG